MSDLSALVLGQASHAGAFRQVLADQAVGVLVGSAFPGVVRIGEVERDASSGFDALVIMELGAIVRRDGFDGTRVLPNQVDRPFGQDGGRTITQFSDQQPAGFALDQGHDAVLGACAHDGVDLPMTELGAGLDNCRPLADHALAGQPSAAVVGRVALPAALSGTAQKQVQVPTQTVIPPDVAVDGFMADPQKGPELQTPGDLLGAPQSKQALLDQREVGLGEMLVAPRPGSSSVGTFLRLARAVVTVISTAVARQLATDRARRPSKLPSHLGLAEPLHPESREPIPLLRGDLGVRHGAFLFLAEGDAPLSRITSLSGAAVALTL